jgi:hypothetical protein
MSAEQAYTRGDLDEVHDPLLRLYLERGWRLFPCRWEPDNRAPIFTGGFYAGSNNAKLVASWLKRWPRARWAMSTGKPPVGSGVTIVDIDRKHEVDGFVTFARLTGSSELPAVPRVHSPSGGTHLYFQTPPQGCFSTIGPGGKRRKGLGPGLDVKSDRTQCHLPCRSPVSLYRWDDQYNLLAIPTLIPLPAVLTPIEVPDEEEIDPPVHQGRPAIGNTNAYAGAALTATCERIRAAVPGVQRRTLNDEAYAIGRLAAGLNLDRQGIVDALIEAGMAMQQGWGKPPWRRFEVKKTVLDAFRDGLRKPKTPDLRSARTSQRRETHA